MMSRSKTARRCICTAANGSTTCRLETSGASRSDLMDVVAAQVAEVQRRYADARLEQAQDGNRVLVVPDVPVCAGWSMPAVTIRVLVPAGYPHVQPDCFYTEAELQLAGGAEPSNSALQPMFGGQYRWFSWHV